MNTQMLAAAVMAGTLSFAGAALAESQTGAMASPMASPMAKDSMAMSKADMKAADACKKMTPEKMAKSARCQKLAKMYPEAMMTQPMGSMSTDAMGKTAR